MCSTEPEATQKKRHRRLEILLLYGGVYVDTDFEALRSIEPLLGGVAGFAPMKIASMSRMRFLRAHLVIRL